MSLWTSGPYAGGSSVSESDPSLSGIPALRTLPARPIAVGLIATDVVAIVAAFWAAHLARDAGLAVSTAGRVTATALVAALLCVPLFGACGLHEPANVVRGWRQTGRLLRGWVLLLGVVILGIFILKAGAPLRSRLALIYFFAFGLAGTELFRLGLWRPWLRARYGRELRGARVIVGSGRLARRAAAAGGYKEGTEPALVGFVDDPEAWSRRSRHAGPLAAPFLGGLEMVPRLARERRISEVLVAREDLSRGRLVELAHRWLDEGVRVNLVSSAFEVMVARASGNLLGGVPLAELQRSPQRGWGLKIKRLIDVAAVLAGGLLLLPVFAAVAAGVKLSSPGPVLYRQVRVGLHGRRFVLYKFRSMVVGNDDGAHREYVQALMHDGTAAGQHNGRKVYKLVDDPRITPWGAFLRRASLDELPQLWNVLKGDMSLVGPRPCLPYEWEMYEDWQRHRMGVLPGITGLWQVTGRSEVSFEEMVLLDLNYIANWSLGLDLALLTRTIPVVLSGAGGH